MKVIFADHAIFEMNRRGIGIEQVKEIIQYPQQELQSSKGRVILQNIFHDSSIDRKKMLLRVIGLRSADNFKVITVYKTSKIEKYCKEVLQ